MNLAVVTSCHNYGQYLREWAESILSLTTRPAVVAIVDNGSTDATPHQAAEAQRILLEGGLSDVRVQRIPRTDFGSARNAAVELGAGPEWVMHMDADDVFLPHCLDDVAALAPQADVVALGYQRFGDLHTGPRNRTRVYTSSQGAATLKSQAPASGVSPFRRSFWERSPYRTDMTGGWDTALWIGFAHLDARFVATRRPCFLYRQHADSVFNTRRKNLRAGRVVGAKLNDLRGQRSGVSILVPRRCDGGPRDASWDLVRRRYAELHPEWEVVDGFCSDGPWRKGAAVADALARSRGQTLVIADSDCVLPVEALREAVSVVEERRAPWVVPHTLVKRLDRRETDRVLAEQDLHPPYDDRALHREAYEGFAGGGFIVVDASAYAATGGMPLAFQDWGAEDEATALMLDTLVGPHVRLPYDLWHLWHPPARRTGATKTHLNRSMLRLVASKAGDPDGMFELVERMNRGTPLTQLAAGGGGVTMVAYMDFQRGTEVVKKGHLFVCTEDEARRHEGRPRRIAVRADSMSAAQLAALSPHRTAEIHSEQHMRNLAANAARTGGG